jgi:lipopolysaccharide export system protein LptA
MRNLLLTLSLTAMTLGAHGAEPAVKELIVETDWKLSGAKIDQSEKPGEGVTKMIAAGGATVTKEKEEGQGKISVTGKADTVEYHVIQKKFVLRGSPSVTRLDTKGSGSVLRGTKPNSIIEIRAHDSSVHAEGPNKTTLIDSDTPANAKPKRK